MLLFSNEKKKKKNPTKASAAGELQVTAAPLRTKQSRNNSVLSLKLGRLLVPDWKLTGEGPTIEESNNSTWAFGLVKSRLVSIKNKNKESEMTEKILSRTRKQQK
ncbi:hypothetical protein NPIL_104301 [Nephila pilipes]|uniref:Uncharacterized protein n=1 Tax=Nephila pilipes TaxID=299642 RepID=A0A8X6N302_NEPPI|nr:hypothetical protein NPIL_104301 [Nephila pilipes]